MDPNANMQQQEELMAIVRNPRTTPGGLKKARAELRELRVALVDWLKGGGFEPDWHRFPKATPYFFGIRRVS